MQAVGVGQGDGGTGPVGGHITAQGLQHRATAGGTPQFMAAPLDQQRAQAFEQGLMRLPQAGQAKQATEGLAQVAHGFVRGDERQPRALDRLFAVQPPQAIAQGQGVHLLQHRRKTVTHAVGLAQQAGAAPHQFLEIISRHAQANHLRVQRQFLGRTLQQFEQGLGAAGAAQGLAEICFAQGTGQQLQQAQVFVGLGGNADGQVNDLAVAPVHALGELQQAHAGGEHLVAGFGGAVGNGDALAEKGRALGLAGLQAGQIAFGDQAIGHQFVGEQPQGRGLIHRRLANGYLLQGEFEHAFSYSAPGGARYFCRLGVLIARPQDGLSAAPFPRLQTAENTPAETFNLECSARYFIFHLPRSPAGRYSCDLGRLRISVTIGQTLGTSATQ